MAKHKQNKGPANGGVSKADKPIRLNKREIEEQKIVKAMDVLRGYNPPKPKVVKKPLVGQLIEVFEDFLYILDIRKDSIPESWKPCSFKKERQYKEFFKSFIYKYYVPEVLLDSYLLHKEDNRRNYLGPTFQWANKWLYDLITGGSFYKKNKDIFTKAEAHCFLNSKLKYKDDQSIFNVYYEAKCEARGFDLNFKNMIVGVFSEKFGNPLIADKDKTRIINEFIDFLGRNKDYGFTRNSVADIADYIRYCFGSNATFSFAGRTVGSVMNLSNEWHAEAQRQRVIKTLGVQEWEGLPFNDFSFENNQYSYNITQLCSAKDLLNEGRKMHHCVSSYASSASSGHCGIFNVSRFDKKCYSLESTATLEINSSGALVQARAAWNKDVDRASMKIIKMWAANNNIRMRRYR